MDIAVETEVSARKLSALDQQLAQMEIETRQIDRLTEALKKGDYGYLAAETVFPSINDALITKLLKSLSDLEIKKSAAPDRREVKKYSVIDKASLNRGSGGIICMCEEVVPIDAQDCFIPCNLI